MAIIPLRAYNREIEGWIDNGQLDEAVAHCRHILTTFPKHIATYRLLGKAHLEQQRISDATDIFQRVLSSVPDDFIANVGMSIIREDENNLDASIWHMELAYEAQPANVAIQDELRRLYGRRDGVQPPKVRLTRGALAKMYAKGGLYDQAVAELRAAINEDPNRADLQLLLAEMFFQISQRVEAVETCVSIVKKLPFCLFANQILAVCLPESERSETSKNYRQIAISMDPYFAFTGLESISSDQVAENAVNIEKLDWKPGVQVNETPTQPAWATSLGISIEKQADEKLPEWLQGTEPVAQSDAEAPANISPFIWDTQEVEKIITDASKPEDEIPDWMKDAGWKQATEETIQNQNEAEPEPLAAEEGVPEELVKAEIPDWLRGIEPIDMIEEKPAESIPEEKDTSNPWLEKQQPGPTDTIIQWLETKEPEKPALPIEPEAAADESLEEIPDWLKDLDVTYPTKAQAQKPAEEVLPSAEITPAFTDESFLAEPLEELKAEDILPGKTDVPIEITETPEIPPTPEAEELPAAFADELPDWIKELAGESSEAAPLASLDEEPEIESLSKITPTTINESPVSPVEMVTDTIEGLSEENSVQEMPVISEEEVKLEPPVEMETEMPAEMAATPAEAESLPWLEEFIPEPGSKEEELSAPGTVNEVTTSPEWMAFESEAKTNEPLKLEEPSTEEISPIAAEEIPEWIRGLGEIQDDETQAEPPPTTGLEAEIPHAEELPSWLSELEPPAETEESAPAPQGALEWKEEELPDWIKEITESAPPDEKPPVGDLSVAEAMPSITELPEIEEVAPPTELPVAEGEPIASELPVMEEIAPPSELPLTEETLVTPQLPVAEEETPITELSVDEEIPSTTDLPFTEGLLTEAETRILEWEPEETQVADLEESKPVVPKLEELPWVTEVEAIEEHAPEATVENEIISIGDAGALEEESSKAPTSPLQEPPLPIDETGSIYGNTLEDAQNAVAQGDNNQAVDLYTSLIKQNLHLEEVIKDLQGALYRFPVDVRMWVTLGDAYLHANDLPEALMTYCKAEDLVR